MNQKTRAKRPPPADRPLRDAGPQTEHEDAWFYDELMTPQPDAAREFFRNQAKRLAQSPEPRKKD